MTHDSDSLDSLSSCRRKEQEQASLALLYAPLSIVILSSTGLVLSINQKACQVLGLESRGNLLQSSINIDELLHMNLLVGHATFLPLLSTLSIFNSECSLELFCSPSSLLSSKPQKRRINISHWTPNGFDSYYTLTISEELSSRSVSSSPGIAKPLAKKHSFVDLSRSETPSSRSTRSVISTKSDNRILRLRSSLASIRSLAGDRPRVSVLVAPSVPEQYGEEYLVWESFQFVATSLDIPVWLASKEGEPYWWSSMWKNTFGNQKNLCIHQEDEMRSTNMRARFLLLQKPYDIFHRLLTKNDEWKWFKTNWAPIFHPRIKNRCLRWVGTCQDVNEQILALEEAELAREQLMMVIDKAGLYLYIYDRNMVCKDFYGPTLDNMARSRSRDGPSHIKKAEYDRVALSIGCHISDLFGEDQDDLVRSMESIISGETKQTQLDIQVRGQWYRCRLAGVLEGDSVQSVVAFNTKVTELKTQEAEMQKSQMEASVAQQSSVAKSQFLANMSHEIRTPISGIIGLASMLQDTPLKPSQKILNDILDFSKIEAGKMLIESVPFDLRQCIVSAVEIVQFIAKSKNVKLELYCSDPGRQVHGDPVRIRQVLLNLMSNAIKFSEQDGSVEVAMHVLSQTNEQLEVEISVHDHGLGIEEHKLKTLFQPFSQADASTTRKFGGTGLGLVICAQLISLMGGTIGLESSLGKGSRAHFRLAFATISRKQMLNMHLQRKLSDRTFVDLSKEDIKILLVEDNSVNRVIAVAALKKLGFIHIDTAENGIIACDKANEPGIQYDIILMDCQMPERDGYEATKIIRQNHTTPIIAMTASAIQGDKEACLAVGMSDYLSKPVRPAALEKMLYKWLTCAEH